MLKYQDVNSISSFEELMEYIEFLKPEERLEAHLKWQENYARQRALKVLQESDKPEDCFFQLNTHEYMRFFLYYTDVFVDRNIYELGLYTAMISMNMISSNYPIDRMLDWLRDADQEKLQDCGDNLPIEGSIEVFRGVINDKDKGSIHRLSWTLSENIAAWFAVVCNRNDRSEGDQPAVYRLVAAPESIFYYTNDRGEEEVVLDPEKCEPAQKLSYMPKPIKLSRE